MFQRIVSYLADQVVVPLLANSKAFQNAAMKTHMGVQNVQKAATSGAEAVGGGLRSVRSETGEFFSTLKDGLKDELAEELRKAKPEQKIEESAAKSDEPTERRIDHNDPPPTDCSWSEKESKPKRRGLLFDDDDESVGKTSDSASSADGAEKPKPARKVGKAFE